ncbi:MAG: hypothetical protein R2764_24085 [Bacteroidales bacterium]
MRLFLLVGLFSLYLAANTQILPKDVTRDKSRYAFGQIYTGFRYGFKETYKPQSAFEFNQGIIGYYHQISES